MMNNECKKNAENFAIAQHVLLSSAKKMVDVDHIASTICDFFKLSFFSLYILQPRNQSFKQSIFIDALKKTQNVKNAQKILSDTRISRDVLSSNAKHINRFTENDTFPNTSLFLPINLKGKKSGFIAFISEDEENTRQYKKNILQLATVLASTINRINQLEEKYDHDKVTHQLIDKSNEAFCQWTEKNGWTFLNTHLLHRIGYEPHNVKIQNIFGNQCCMNEKTWAICQQTLKQCIDSGRTKSLEYKIKAPDGSLRIFQSKLVVQKKSSNGRALEITGVSTDITGAKEISQQTLSNLKMNSWLLDINSLLYRHADLSSIQKSLEKIGEYLGADRAFILLAEKEINSNILAEWSNKTLPPIDSTASFIFPFTKETYEQHCFEDVQQENISSEIKRQAKELGFQSQLVTPIYTNEIISGYFILQSKTPSVFSDFLLNSLKIITKTFSLVITKTNILSELKSRQERFNLAMEAAAYGLWELNLTTKEIHITKNYYSMLGIKRQKEARKSFTPLNFKNIHVDDQEASSRYINQLATGEIETCSFESRHIAIDGEITWLLIRGKVIKWDDTGMPFLATGTITNITQLKKSQMDLELAYQEAQSARIAKGEFLARMSHEIRTPMNAIIGMSYLSLQTDLADKQRSQIQDIDKAAKSLLQIIDDILDFSKIEAGKLIIDRHPFNILKHVDRIASRYKPLALKKGLQFHLIVNPTIPEIILADSTRLKQVLDNLIGNAIKFTEKGSVSLKIDHVSGDEKDNIIFIVSDTGIGLEPSQLDTLFEPFNQADGSSTRQFGGTGIGLSISRHLVELMGGHIQGTGEKGQGSQFRFSIPCIPAKEVETNHSSQTTQSTSTISSGKSSYSPKSQQLKNTASSSNTNEVIANNEFLELKDKKVLLVEDNKVNQKVATGILKHQNIHTTIANNGTEAVYIMKASSENTFDFILMDIEMPYMNGFEATKAIRQLEAHANIPIIAMTANMVGDNKGLYTKTGMNDSISKPIAPEALYLVLQEQLHSSKTHI